MSGVTWGRGASAGNSQANGGSSMANGNGPGSVVQDAQRMWHWWFLS